MGTSTTPREFTAKLGQLEGNIQRSTRAAALAGGRTVKAAVLAEMTKATGGDLRLSGVRSKRSPAGAKIGATYDARSGNNVLVRATGPVQLVENDTPPHDIAPRGRTKTARGRARKGAKALRIGRGFYASAKGTGGSKGRHPWRNGVDRSRPLVAREFKALEARAIKDTFG